MRVARPPRDGPAAMLLAGGAARAQATYGSATIGGRSALMGGTGIALGRDGASPLSQPCDGRAHRRLGHRVQRELLLVPDHAPDDFHQPGPASAASTARCPPNTSLDAWRVDPCPSTFCFFLDVGGSGGNTPDTKGSRAGAARAARSSRRASSRPERQALNATASGYAGDSAGQHASQALSINQWWTRFYVGPSYSVHVTDAVALGGSLQTVGTIANSTWGVDTLVSNAAGKARPRRMTRAPTRTRSTWPQSSGSSGTSTTRKSWGSA